jgi:WD40 repeat protein
MHSTHPLTCSYDADATQVWSLPSQHFLFTLSGHTNWVRSAQISPDGRLAVTGSDDKTVKVRAVDRQHKQQGCRMRNACFRQSRRQIRALRWGDSEQRGLWMFMAEPAGDVYAQSPRSYSTPVVQSWLGCGSCH